MRSRSELESHCSENLDDFEQYRWVMQWKRLLADFHLKRSFKFKRIQVVLHYPDGMRRSDTFHFSRNPADESLRDWGKMTIAVDDKTWKVTMPSSVFRYAHGLADPHHESTLR